MSKIHITIDDPNLLIGKADIALHDLSVLMAGLSALNASKSSNFDELKSDKNFIKLVELSLMQAGRINNALWLASALIEGRARVGTQDECDAQLAETLAPRYTQAQIDEAVSNAVETATKNAYQSWHGAEPSYAVLPPQPDEE